MEGKSDMHVVRWIVLSSIVISAAACGGDKSSATTPGAATGAAGGYVPMNVPCGGAVCQAFYGPGLNAPLEACCADEFTKTCGVTNLISLLVANLSFIFGNYGLVSVFF